jgi:uncharacterized protein (TIGR02391 family)
MARKDVKKIVPRFSNEQLEALSRIIAATDSGLTGTEIGRILQLTGINDCDPINTKWRRLFNALLIEQNLCGYGNHVIGFIHRAYDPVSWVNKKELFESKRSEINKVLAFCGLHLQENGKVKCIEKVTTINEAEERADKLKAILKERNVHPDVLEFCKAELLADNYFHAVLEATKSVASKIRKISRLGSDGAVLVDEAFSLKDNGIPIIAINLLRNVTEQSEQKGFMNLLKGLFGTFRNPTAHAEKIYWPMPEEDALDILAIVSLVHRKLDKSYCTKNFV